MMFFRFMKLGFYKWKTREDDNLIEATIWFDASKSLPSLKRSNSEYLIMFKQAALNQSAIAPIARIRLDNSGSLTLSFGPGAETEKYMELVKNSFKKADFEWCKCVIPVSNTQDISKLFKTIAGYIPDQNMLEQLFLDYFSKDQRMRASSSSHQSLSKMKSY